jgi:hypothetical protein
MVILNGIESVELIRRATRDMVSWTMIRIYRDRWRKDGR